MSDLRTDRSSRPVPTPDRGVPQPGGMQSGGPKRAITAGIALAAVAVFGVGIWFAYDQGVKRGASGAPPLIRADQSPAKVAPDNPGGMQVPNQDKQIFERLGGNQPQNGQVERLLPPPERPIASAPAAVPANGGNASVASSAPAGNVAPTAGPAVTVQNRPAANAQQSAQQPAPPAAPPRTASVQPLNPPAAATAPAARAAATPAPAATPAATPAPARTQAPAPATTAAAGGTARVQLASLPEQAQAQATWTQLQRKFPAELGGLSPSFERVDLGARGIYFRLQAGPLRDRAAAQALCEKLSAAKQGCLVVGR